MPEQFLCKRLHFLLKSTFGFQTCPSVFLFSLLPSLHASPLPYLSTIQHIFINLKYITQQAIKCIKTIEILWYEVSIWPADRSWPLHISRMGKLTSKASYYQQSWLQLQCRTCDTNLDHLIYLVVPKVGSLQEQDSITQELIRNANAWASSQTNPCLRTKMHWNHLEALIQDSGPDHW